MSVEFSYRVLTTPKSAIATEYRRQHPDFGTEKANLPRWALDAAAERTMSQGYSKKRNPVCPSCHVQKSLSGSCNC